MGMNSLDAAETILESEGKPLHSSEITRLMLERGLWTTGGRTPQRTIDASIAVDIKNHDKASRFQRTDKGIFALRSWGMAEYTNNTILRKVRKKSIDSSRTNPTLPA